VRTKEDATPSKGLGRPEPEGLMGAALGYARRGWPVLPCQPRGKQPLTGLVRHGFKQATLDESTISGWWEAAPEANVGLVTGVAFDVLDIDGPEGRDALQASMPEDGTPVYGPTVLTGGGGWHYYVAVTGRGNRAGLLHHVDWRGAGGYVIAPPSVHESGRPYSWEVADDPVVGATAAIVPAPAWLLGLLDRGTVEVPGRPPLVEPLGQMSPDQAAAYGRAALRDEAKAVASAPVGTRNHRLNVAAFKLARLVAAGLLDRAEVVEELLRAADACGFSRPESARTIASGVSAGLARPREVRSLMSTDGPGRTFAQAEGTFQGAHAARQAAAAPVVQRGWPTLAPEARHGLAGKFLELVEPHTEADPAALLVTFLAAVGALVGGGPHAVAEGAEHPARLWVLVVGDTAKARKGTSWAHVRNVLAGVDPGFFKDRVLGGFGSGEALVDAAAAGHDRRLLVVEPEYGRVLAAARREGSTLAQLMRQAWDGDRLAVRSRGGTAVADGAHVSVVAHITRAELLARLAESDALGGTLNRYLVVAARRSKLLPSGGNLDDQAVGDFCRLCRSVADKARQVSILRRTPEAEDLWAAVYAGLAEDDPGGLLGAVTARDAPQVLRLSVAYALLDGTHHIDIPHIRAAQAVWDYCRASAALVFGERTGDRILDALAEAGGELDRTAVRDLFDRHVKAQRLDQAIDLLERTSLATKATKSTHPRGRPRTLLCLASACDKSDLSDINRKPKLSEVVALQQKPGVQKEISEFAADVDPHPVGLIRRAISNGSLDDDLSELVDAINRRRTGLPQLVGRRRSRKG